MRLLFLLIQLWSVSVQAAPTASAVWEIQTGGSTGNGGVYDVGQTSPGTDYSTSTSAHSSGSDLSTSNGTTNPCTVHSASHSFTSDEIANGLTVASGGSFTADTYVVTSLSGSDAVLDKACASIASTNSGVWKLGGAKAFGSATLDPKMMTAIVSGNTVYIKTGTHTPGTNLTATAGSGGANIKFIGYNSSRNDNPTGSTRPLISLGTNTWTGGTSNFYAYLQFSGTAVSPIATGSHSAWRYVKVVNSSTTAARNGFVMSADSTCFSCEAVSYRGNAVNGSTSAFSIFGSYIHDSDVGITSASTTGAVTIVGNVIESNVTAAIKQTASNTVGFVVYGNTLSGGVSNKTGTGILINTGSTGIRSHNNIIYGFATGASHADATSTAYFYDDGNAYNNNTADVSNVTKGPSDVTSAPQFLSVLQVTGTAGSLSSSTITDNSADFSNVVNNQDFVYIISGTGATAGQYLITAHGTHTITTDSAPGGSGSDITYQVTTGRNFGVQGNMENAAIPAAFPAALTTNYQALGAAQEQFTDPGVSKVKLNQTYIFQNATKTGTRRFGHAGGGFGQ